MKYTIDFDMAAMVLVVCILIHFLHRKSIRVPQTQVFKGLVWTCVLTVLLDMLAVLVEEYRMPNIVVGGINVIYLIMFNMLPFMYYFYLLISVRNRSTWKWMDRIILYAPVAFSVLLILSSPLTGIVFRYSQVEGYQRGEGFPMLYLATVAYMAASIYLAVIYRQQMNIWKRVTVFFYVATSALGVVVQALIPDLLVLQFAVTVTLLLLYMSLESPNDDEDKELEIYNRRGFDKMIGAKVGRREPFHVLVVSMLNFHTLREAVGVEFSQVMLRRIVEELQDELKKSDLFYLASGKLAVVVEQDKAELDNAVRAIQHVLMRPLELEDMNILMELNLLQIDFPQEVNTLEDVMGAVDYSGFMPFESSGGEVFHGSAEILRRKSRERKIVQAMKRALLNGSFEVYYQPIYSSAQQKYNSAEALIRLKDEEMGFISPEEFIPLAEKNGMILKIGEFVFRTVCEMISREKIREKGIDYIEVNLSAVQCMQEDICKKFYRIMDEYKVPYSAINLEVTESTLAQEVLWNTMEQMAEGGVTFSLDDYGTGYSNLSNILKYPFHIVKLDKSMLWDAMKNEIAMRALRHTVAMVQDLNMHTLVEGVETEEQKNVLLEMGCEYLQGYFFSRPVPEPEFLAQLEG